MRQNRGTSWLWRLSSRSGTKHGLAHPHLARVRMQKPNRGPREQVFNGGVNLSFASISECANREQVFNGGIERVGLGLRLGLGVSNRGIERKGKQRWMIKKRKQAGIYVSILGIHRQRLGLAYTIMQDTMVDEWRILWSKDIKMLGYTGKQMWGCKDKLI